MNTQSNDVKKRQSRDIQMCRHCGGEIKGKDRYSKKEAAFYRAWGDLSHGKCIDHFADMNHNRNLAGKLLIGGNLLYIAGVLMSMIPMPEATTVSGEVVGSYVQTLPEIMPLTGAFLAGVSILFTLAAWESASWLKKERKKYEN